MARLPPSLPGAIGAAARAAALSLLAVAPAAAGDFADGLAAYDAGNAAAAAATWRPLAEAGDVEAQTALAELYASGALGEPDAAAAARWYRRAAEQGAAVAQLNLGDMYARGAGVPRDPVMAYVWLALAADQGRAWAARRRAEVAAGLTPAQLAEAERRLAERRGE